MRFAIGAAEKINSSYVGRLLRMTLLAPKIVEAILDGRQPTEMTLAVLMGPFSVGWREQSGVCSGRSRAACHCLHRATCETTSRPRARRVWPAARSGWGSSKRRGTGGAARRSKQRLWSFLRHRGGLYRCSSSSSETPQRQLHEDL